MSILLFQDPQQRPSTDVLLQHGFINCNLDAKPIKDLLLEYKAEVVEEVVDDETEVSYSFDYSLYCLLLPAQYAPVLQPELEMTLTLSVFCISLFYTLPPCPFYYAHSKKIEITNCDKSLNLFVCHYFGHILLSFLYFYLCVCLSAIDLEA